MLLKPQRARLQLLAVNQGLNTGELTTRPL
jgi:hypothetical protein